MDGDGEEGGGRGTRKGDHLPHFQVLILALVALHNLLKQRLGPLLHRRIRYASVILAPHTDICADTRKRARTHTCTRTQNTYTHTHTLHTSHTYMYPNTYIVHRYIRTHMHKHIHMHMHINTCTCT